MKCIECVCLMHSVRVHENAYMKSCTLRRIRVNMKCWIVADATGIHVWRENHDARVLRREIEWIKWIKVARDKFKPIGTFILRIFICFFIVFLGTRVYKWWWRTVKPDGLSETDKVFPPLFNKIACLDQTRVYKTEILRKKQSQKHRVTQIDKNSIENKNNIGKRDDGLFKQQKQS